MARLGLAVDIGTTNIAGFIINFDKQKDFYSLSIKNSQCKHGFDVISRLTYAGVADNVKNLQKLLVNDLNNLTHALTKKIKINRKRIEKVIVSGNTIMLHFLLGLDVSGLLAYPYTSKIKDSVGINASQIGLVASPRTILITLPAISPYVGADVVAGILYTGMHKISSNKILLDLGTNAEIVIGNKNKLIATSAAAGPAFKSRNIPLGSDMISSAAKMLRDKQMDAKGKIVKEHPLITQEDIRSLQLAKGAIRAAIEILLEKSGLKLSAIKKILLAGMFGEKIDCEDAVTIGLVPRLPSPAGEANGGQAKVKKNLLRSVGNSSLDGAKMALLTPELLDAAKEIAASVEHVELSLEASYQDRFLKNIDFE